MPLSRKQHPLQTIEGSVLWRTVEKQIASFVRNGDMQELTAREYIVGSICQAIAAGKQSN
jgi:hypothetical protein